MNTAEYKPVVYTLTGITHTKNGPAGPYKPKGGRLMARRRGVMSDRLKMELAEELGVADIVRAEGDFGSVSSRDCGNLVRLAIEKAERSMV
jgi:small acid-soluble spore protein F (minor alpha/beta-type SASP)